MPGATTERAYPYPLGPEPPDAQGDIQRLAEAIDVDVALVASMVPRPLPAVPTTVTSTPFTIPQDVVSRRYLINWGWWAWGMNVNGSMLIAMRTPGGAAIGEYNIPYAAGVSPVPTLSGYSAFGYDQPAGAPAVTLNAVIEGGNGPWQAQGYLLAVGYYLP